MVRVFSLKYCGYGCMLWTGGTLGRISSNVNVDDPWGKRRWERERGGKRGIRGRKRGGKEMRGKEGEREGKERGTGKDYCLEDCVLS
eukprot:1143491-Amorphochlora_amoeboformis.AAC.1